MSDLDDKEQNYVRTALRHLRRRLGTWAAVADGLRCATATVTKTSTGRDAVSASMALRVARLLGIMVDDLLVGRFLPPGACPNCGHVPVNDFTDESTVVEQGPRLAPSGGLKVVK